MSETKTFKAIGLVAKDTSGVLDRFEFERREPEVYDVLIEIAFCGICHSDLHQLRSEWSSTSYYPMVPGHEIVGTVKKIGPKVGKFKVGDRVGVGCFVFACGECEQCQRGQDNYCVGSSKSTDGMQLTYNCCLKDPVNVHIKNCPEGELLFGGYSSHITVHENYVLRVPKEIPLESAGPLLCAGITTYSPLMYYGKLAKNIFSQDQLNVGVVGFGGLGHMAVMLAKAMGHRVSVFSRSDRKRDAAMEIGCDSFVISTDKDEMAQHANSLHLIIDTVSAEHDVDSLIAGLLKIEGLYCIVGVPPSPFAISPGTLIFGRKLLGGSLIGGIRETQEVLDFCAKHKCIPKVELIDADEVNRAMYELSQNEGTTSRFVIRVADSLTPKLNDNAWHVESEPRIDISSWNVNPNATIIPPEANLHKDLTRPPKSGREAGSSSGEGRVEKRCKCGEGCKCAGKHGEECRCTESRSNRGNYQRKECGFLCQYSNNIVATVGVALLVGLFAMYFSSH